MKTYENLKRIPGEKRYVDFDEDTGLWCVFGEKSGFAYSSWSTESAAKTDLMLTSWQVAA